MLDTVKSKAPTIAITTAGALVAMAAVGGKGTVVKILGTGAIMAVCAIVASKIA